LIESLTTKVLAIGDIGNIFHTIKKYAKSKIHVVNFYKDGAGVYTYADDVETFQTYKVNDHVKRINEIKDNFDICITMGTGERIAYLCDLNYAIFYVGNDIDAPRFLKNSKEPGFNEPLHKLNMFERWFYKNAFKNAIAHLAYAWVFEHLKKYTKNGIKLDVMPVDPTLFNSYVKPIDREKRKFTFFMPQRIGRPKGSDLIWKALSYCKSDFEILQVDWFEEATSEELIIKDELLRTKPPQVTLVPMINRSDMSRYYTFADAVIGNMRNGIYALIELEAAMCRRPVIQYTDPNMKIIAHGKEIKSPFLPTSNDPKIIAEVIDKVVTSEDFRKKLVEEQHKFVKEITDPEKIAAWWDSFFEDLVKKHRSIRKKSPWIRTKLRCMFFLIANRLYFKKIKKVVTGSNYQKTGQTLYDLPRKTHFKE